MFGKFGQTGVPREVLDEINNPDYSFCNALLAEYVRVQEISMIRQGSTNGITSKTRKENEKREENPRGKRKGMGRENG